MEIKIKIKIEIINIINIPIFNKPSIYYIIKGNDNNNNQCYEIYHIKKYYV